MAVATLAGYQTTLPVETPISQLDMALDWMCCLTGKSQPAVEESFLRRRNKVFLMMCNRLRADSCIVTITAQESERNLYCISLKEPYPETDKCIKKTLPCK